MHKGKDLQEAQITLPFNYPYNVPHVIFANFGYWHKKGTQQTELHDLHILGFPLIPWYKKNGEFFEPALVFADDVIK